MKRRSYLTTSAITVTAFAGCTGGDSAQRSQDDATVDDDDRDDADGGEDSVDEGDSDDDERADDGPGILAPSTTSRISDSGTRSSANSRRTPSARSRHAVGPSPVV